SGNRHWDWAWKGRARVPTARWPPPCTGGRRRSSASRSGLRGPGLGGACLRRCLLRRFRLRQSLVQDRVDRLYRFLALRRVALFLFAPFDAEGVGETLHLLLLLDQRRFALGEVDLLLEDDRRVGP